MSNVVFNGNIYDQISNLADDVAYRLYFKKNNTGSSDSVWSDIRYTEIGGHQYNINLGDEDLLGNTGTASAGDEVILLFWIPDTFDQHSTLLTQWSAIHYILDASLIYPQHVQILDHQNPTCDFTFEGFNANQTSSVIDLGSHDHHEWIFQTKEHFQKHTFLDQILFDINAIPAGSVDINWGDTTFTNNVSLSASPFEHIYTDSGSYNVSIDLYNSDLLTCNQIIPIDIVDDVVHGLTWVAPVYLKANTEYIPVITGNTASIVSVDYYIDTVPTYLNLAFDQSFNHTFTTPGDHQVRQCINYYNGFEHITECQNFTVQMGTVAHYNEAEYQCGLQFVSDSSIGSPPVISYLWEATHNGNVLATLEGAEHSTWYFAFPYEGVFQVKLTVQDQNSTVSYAKEYTIDECQTGTGASGGGGGGGSSPWIYQEYKEPEKVELPKVKILSIDSNENSAKKILILEIKEL